jgi:1-acyl-sn-glycerol-3-phosphate acyltransferase
MQLRSTAKTTILVLSLAESLGRFALLRMRTRLQHRREPDALERATWLHGCCHRILHRLRLRLATNAALPTRGLIVSNHLSHLDILLYGSLGPIIFVSKEEVRGWPLLGKLAENGGTVFVDRDRPAQAAEAAQQIENYLRGDIPVLLFPEGTSTDGSSVLPFRSPLFEPAMRAGCPITAAAIAYSADGVKEEALAYYGDKVFFPHLSATLGCKNLSGSILFAGSTHYVDRKEAARVTHSLVGSLRSNSTNATPKVCIQTL